MSQYSGLTAMLIIQAQFRRPKQLHAIFQYFEDKTSLRHNAQGFEEYTFIKSYRSEKGTCVKTLKVFLWR